MISGSSEQITLKSTTIQALAKDGPIFLNTNRNIQLSASEKITFDVGVVGSPSPQNVFQVNSPKIELGLQTNPVNKLEAIPKSDQLIIVLQQMLSIMNDIINNPEEIKCITGEIELLQQQLYKIKSEISFTV